MASLIENLIDVLENMSLEYENLLGLSIRKTPVIVAGDLNKLSQITEEEQIVVGKINRLDQAMGVAMQDIANVINKDVKQFKVADVINFLQSRPQEQEKLAEVYERLRKAVRKMARTNEQNGELIHNALEMVEFDMNVLQAMRAAPETANYNRGAYNTGNAIGVDVSGFDARQ